MRVAIAGGHGQIALRLARLLSQRGDEVVGLIRNPNHADDVRQAGAEPAVVDLEHASVDDVAQSIAGCDAVVSPPAPVPGAGLSARRRWTTGAQRRSPRPSRAGRPLCDRQQHGGGSRHARRRHLQRTSARAARTRPSAQVGSTGPSYARAGSPTTPARATSTSATASHEGESHVTTSRRCSPPYSTRRTPSARQLNWLAATLLSRRPSPRSS